jgi:NADH dehydrogenase
MQKLPIEMQRVVVVGGGFGGLRAVRALRRAPVNVSLVDRRNYHLFQPLLYQVATGELSPANIAAPLRALVARQRNAQVLLAEVADFDVHRRRALLVDGELAYDTLVVAAGASHSYFGHPEWEPLAPGLKTVEDATEIRARVLTAFEIAERLGGGPAAEPWLTFVVVGGGPTGVELAGALAEVARHTLRDNFRSIDPRAARIIVVEAGPAVLGQFDASLAEKARLGLERLGVSVWSDSLVTKIEPGAVVVRRAGGAEERIEAQTVLWAAGVQASPLGRALASATGAAVDRAGRVFVEPDLTIKGWPEIFVIGDLAHLEPQPGRPLPALAPVAQQQGKYVGRLIAARLTGRTLPPFRYRDLGTMATVGRKQAVADLGGWRFSGAPAWLLWLFVHLMAIVQFENRLLVLIQWAWNYVTWNRSARLITGERASAAAAPRGAAESPGCRREDAPASGV